MVIVKLVFIVLVFSAVWFSGPSTCCWRSRRGDHWLARPKTSMVSWYRPAFCWYNFFLHLLSLVVEQVECLHPLSPNWNHSLLKWSTKCHCQMEVMFFGSFSSIYSFLWWIWGNLGIGISSLDTGWTHSFTSALLWGLSETAWKETNIVALRWSSSANPGTMVLPFIELLSFGVWWQEVKYLKWLQQGVQISTKQLSQLWHGDSGEFKQCQLSSQVWCMQALQTSYEMSVE